MSLDGGLTSGVRGERRIAPRVRCTPGLGLAVFVFRGGDGNNCFSFDFDEERGIYELADLDHGGGGTNGAEELAVGAADRLPLGDVGNEHASADDVMKRRTGLLECGLDSAEGLHGLKVRIARADDAGRSDRGRASDENVLADANGAGVADDGLPWPAAGDVDSRVTHAKSLTVEERRTLRRRA